MLRKIEQDEEAFNNYLDHQALAQKLPRDVSQGKALRALGQRGPRAAHGRARDDASCARSGEPFDFKEDREGFGCPFGAHIRRINPRSDTIAPARMRPIFRRGMPYGPLYSEGTKHKKRGLIGLFFCASIEDQFEIVMSQWVENKPMGPANRGNAKDPLVGRHDEDSVFRIPREGKSDIELAGFQPFVTTLGTAYALFPSRSTLDQITRATSDASRQGVRANAPYQWPTTEWATGRGRATI